MTAADTRELIAATSGRALEPEGGALEAIAAACGRLPLALVLAGGMLRARPAWSVRDLASQLERGQPAVTGELHRLLYAAVDTCIRHLPEAARNQLAVLGRHPAGRISLHAAAALADLPLDQAETHLFALTGYHLLDEARPGRYRLHSVVRSYTADLLARADPARAGEQADDRLLDYALHALAGALALYHPRHRVPPPNPPQFEVPTFDDAVQAGTWLAEQYPMLRAVLEHAGARGRERKAAHLTNLLAPYLDRRGYWRDALPLLQAALATWRDAEDPAAGIRTLINLATAYWRLRDYGQAERTATDALRQASALDRPTDRADCYLILGRIYNSRNDLHQARAWLREAVAVHIHLHDPAGHAEALDHLSVVQFRSGVYQRALANGRRAVELAAAGGELAVERNALNNLAFSLQQCGQYPEALTLLERALRLALNVGDQRNTAIARLNVGETLVILDRPVEAGPTSPAPWPTSPHSRKSSAR